VKWVLLASNVIMASFSVVNGVPGDRGALQGNPARRAAPGGAGSDRAAGSEPASGVVPVGRSIGAVAAQAVRPAAVAALLGTAAFLRHRYLRWGATDTEQHRALPGDEVLPTVNLSATRAITIKAAADDIWPWLAQLGQGRGGFYSYDWLENLVARIDIHNADRIVPEWQHITVGAEVALAPQVRLKVVVLEPGRAMVLRGSVPMGQVAPPYDFTWAFVVSPQPSGTTRLVVRERYEYSRPWAALIVQPAELVSCLMTPRMLRGIKTRAEHRPTPPSRLRGAHPDVDIVRGEPLTADRGPADLGPAAQ